MRVPGLVDDEEVDRLKTNPILKMFQRKDSVNIEEEVLTSGNPVTVSDN